MVPRSATYELCGSVHGNLTVPSGIYLVAWLNCTAVNNTVYASYASALTFESGSYLEFESVTSSSLPFYMGTLSMASGVPATVYVSDTTVPLTVTLAEYENSGDCTLAASFTIDGCPSGATCEVTQTSNGNCTLVYSQTNSTATTQSPSTPPCGWRGRGVLGLPGVLRPQNM